jgi:hypothetical protein
VGLAEAAVEACLRPLADLVEVPVDGLGGDVGIAQYQGVSSVSIISRSRTPHSAVS